MIQQNRLKREKSLLTFPEWEMFLPKWRGGAREKRSAGGLRPAGGGMGERSAQGAAGPSSTGWSWRPSRAAWAASATREKSATREAGFSSGSSCRKGTR